MARGWESKSVESQVEQAGDRRRRREPVMLTPEQRLTESRRSKLSLDRTRVLGEIQRCCNTRFRSQLDSELAFLDAELKRLQS
jgi:hypothetical protein